MRYLTSLLLLVFLFAPILSAADSQALLYDFQGDVFTLKEGASEWFPAQKGQIVNRGDVIWSGKDSFAEISLDQTYKNIFRVEKDTKAEVRSLNPADIFLEDGSLYSSLEGFSSGQIYQVVTPTAVASVRGTHFYSEYEPSKQESQYALMPHDDQVESKLAVQLKTESKTGEEVVLQEGQEAVFSGSAETPQIQTIDPEKVEEEEVLYRAIQNRIEAAKAQNPSNPPIDLIFINPGEKQNP